MKQGGDDLSDDFILEDDFVQSGEEYQDDGFQSESTDEVRDQMTADSGEDAGAEKALKSQATAERKRKRKEKTKERKAKRRKLVETVDSFENSTTAQSPHSLAAYLSSMQAKTFPTMSAIELDDIHIPETSIADTTMWTAPRTLDQLVNFIIKVLPKLHTRLLQKSKTNGAPTLIFVAGAALRVADVTRVLKDKTLRGEKGGDVAKLFAKHFKLAEHVTYLRRTKVGAAVGTPGRIGKLLCETDALTIPALSHIILDTTYQDAKKRCLLDIPETRDEVFKTVLGAPKVLEAIRLGKIQVVLF